MAAKLKKRALAEYGSQVGYPVPTSLQLPIQIFWTVSDMGFKCSHRGIDSAKYCGVGVGRCEIIKNKGLKFKVHGMNEKAQQNKEENSNKKGKTPL